MSKFNTEAQKAPTVKIGRTETSILQCGWWQAGGPPYFPMPDLDQLIRVRQVCAERGVVHDLAPAYGKGMSEMLMYITYCYLEPDWRAAGLKFRRESDPIFTKCGLYWPRDSKMATHADMHRSPDLVFGRPPEQVTGEDVKQLILKEFEESCVRMNVDYIHGFQLHWPLTKAGKDFALDWMADGVVAAYAELWKQNRVGAVGFANAGLKMLQAVNAKAKQLAAEMGEAGKGFQVHFIQNDRSMLGVEVHGSPYGNRDICFGELADYCKAEGIARMAYSSLGHGPPIPPPGPFVYVDHWMESEQQQREMYDYRSACHAKFAAMAKKIGCSSPQMGLAWLMGHGLIPIFSATVEKFLIDDIEAVNYIDAVKQASEEIEALTADYREGLWAIISKYRTTPKW